MHIPSFMLNWGHGSKGGRGSQRESTSLPHQILKFWRSSPREEVLAYIFWIVVPSRLGEFWANSIFHSFNSYICLGILHSESQSLSWFLWLVREHCLQEIWVPWWETPPEYSQPTKRQFLFYRGYKKKEVQGLDSTVNKYKQHSSHFSPKF